MAMDDVKSKFDSIISEITNTQKFVTDRLTYALEDSDKKLGKLETERNDYKSKYEVAQSKLDKIEKQLASTVEQLESLTKTKAKGIDAMQLLDVYLVLMENVFESSAHTRLLIMLHGEKESYTISDLTTAAGISAIQVRQAIFELRNAGIVDYDDETQVVTLKMKFMD